MLFSIYIDDLIKELRSSGYGTHLSNLFIGSILYADDIRLSCDNGKVAMDLRQTSNLPKEILRLL